MCTNISIIGVPERKEGEKGVKNVFDEIMAENFLNLKKAVRMYRKGKIPLIQANIE